MFCFQKDQITYFPIVNRQQKLLWTLFSAQEATIIFKIRKCLPLSVEDIVVEKPVLELCAVGHLLGLDPLLRVSNVWQR